MTNDAEEIINLILPAPGPLDLYLDDDVVYVVSFVTGRRLTGTLHAQALPGQTSLVRLVPNDNRDWWHDFNPAHVVMLRPAGVGIEGSPDGDG